MIHVKTATPDQPARSLEDWMDYIKAERMRLTIKNSRNSEPNCALRIQEMMDEADARWKQVINNFKQSIINQYGG